jgi:hypothetical protein
MLRTQALRLESSERALGHQRRFQQRHGHRFARQAAMLQFSLTGIARIADQHNVALCKNLEKWPIGGGLNVLVLKVGC